MTKIANRVKAGRFALVHGEAGRQSSKEYNSWRGMIARCYNTNAKGYRRYGGRGIVVCDRWRYGEEGLTAYQCFLADMGRRPTPKHSIDRFPDNDGPYNPDNTRWATMPEQAHSSRGNPSPNRGRRRGPRVAFDKIAEGLTEALEITRGAAKPYKLHVPPEIDVAGIRDKLHLSQEDFAAHFGFTVNQIRDWEQGRSRPLGGVRAYLMIIDQDPKRVVALLRAVATSHAA